MNRKQTLGIILATLLALSACASKPMRTPRAPSTPGDIDHLAMTLDRLDRIQTQMAKLEGDRSETLKEIRVLQMHYRNLEEQYRIMAETMRAWRIERNQDAAIIEEQQKVIQSLEHQRQQIEIREKHFKNEIATHQRTIRSQKRLLSEQARKIQQQEEAIRELMKPRL